MYASTSDSGGVFANPESFVLPTAGVEATPGVAALDSPALQQTKSEIRSLAAELAQLAHTALEPEDFYDGFLPRLCSAMGAKGAGVWRLDTHAAPYLVASHLLPSTLFREVSAEPAAPSNVSKHAQTTREALAHHHPTATQPSESHQRILQCVAAEGQPILVPPGSVKLEAERPTNPLSDALIVIPIRPEENIQYLLEVVQRPSGGPAAQRGYLRFVAQMGDLMADYLRRQQLREYAAERERLQRIEDWLTAIASANAAPQQQQLVADALVDLFPAERSILILQRLRSHVSAINGTRSFDPRSEVVLSALALHSHYRQQCASRDQSAVQVMQPPLWFQATNRRTPAAATDTTQTTEKTLQIYIDRLCDSIACRSGVLLPLDESDGWYAILTFADDSPQLQLGDQTAGEKNWRLLRSLSGLLHSSRLRRSWYSYAPVSARLGLAGTNRRRSQLQSSTLPWVQYWLLRAALAGLVLAVACFPVSQQIAATAVLQPLSKQMYYAPSAGIVTQVLIDEGDTVDSGTPLLQLSSHELETESENLQIELTKTRGQIDEKNSRLNRGEALSSLERDQLDFDISELQTTEQALELRTRDTAERLRELSIVARQAGTLSTWDLRNRLLNHPVQAGQLLASTFDPNDKWRLLLSIPDYRTGLVAAALEQAPQGAVPVHFSLASHPDQVLQAYAVAMAPQVTTQNDSFNSTAHVVKTEAYIHDTTTLPLKKDGAIARATIDCGTVPLCWLIFRDAYWAASSRFRMLW